jgi:hypothetical protein
VLTVTGPAVIPKCPHVIVRLPVVTAVNPCNAYVHDWPSSMDVPGLVHVPESTPDGRAGTVH